MGNNDDGGTGCWFYRHNWIATHWHYKWIKWIYGPFTDLCDGLLINRMVLQDIFHINPIVYFVV